MFLQHSHDQCREILLRVVTLACFTILDENSQTPNMISIEFPSSQKKDLSRHPARDILPLEPENWCRAVWSENKAFGT